MAVSNNERKERFVQEFSELGSIQAHYRWCLKRVEPMESKLGKDVCAFTVDELREAVTGGTGMRTTSAQNNLSSIKKYVDWCIKQGIPDANPELLKMQISDNATSKLSLNSLKDPYELQEYLDALFVPEGEMTMSNTYRVLLWLAFEGVSDDDIMFVRSKDVDLRARIVHVREQSYNIHSLAIPAFRNCVSSNVFYRVVWGAAAEHSRCDGDYILRGIKKLPSLRTALHAIACSATEARKQGKTQKRLTLYTIRLSGTFYRYYIMEKSDIPLDFVQLAKQRVCGKEEPSGDADRKRKTITDTSSRLRRDYEQWKKAHELI